MDYIEIEENLRAAANQFAAAFDGIKNARILKTQKNGFDYKYKHPLIMLGCCACIAAIICFQIVYKQYDALFILCEAVVVVALVAAVVLSALTLKVVRQNARCAERIFYQSGKNKLLQTQISGGGEKVEWDKARFWFGNGEFELIEGGEKEYSPYVYKKIRGHSRGFVLFDCNALLKTFFDDSEVVQYSCGEYRLASGFSFKVTDGRLDWFEIEGMFSECFENNFPFYALLAYAPSYRFRYTIEQANDESMVFRLPELMRDACEMYFLMPPKGDNIVVPDYKK